MGGWPGALWPKLYVVDEKMPFHNRKKLEGVFVKKL